MMLTDLEPLVNVDWPERALTPVLELLSKLMFSCGEAITRLSVVDA